MTAVDLNRLDELVDETKRLCDALRRLRSAFVVSATNYSQTGENGSTGDPVSCAKVAAGIYYYWCLWAY